MKKKIIILGLVGSLTLGNTVMAANHEDMKITNPAPIIETLEENKIIIKMENIEHPIDNGKVDIEIPVIQGLKDLEYQEQLNYLIRLTTENDLEIFKEQAKKLLELDIEWEPEMRVSYEVKSEGRVLSFIINSYFYTGGANGISRIDYYNIDTEENKSIELSSLFKKNSDFKTVINNEINKQIEEQVDIGEKIYFEGENGFTTISDAQSFYIDENGNLVIAFSMYEIGPRYIGHPEFTIPKDSIISILEDKGVLTVGNNKVRELKKIVLNDKEIELKNPIFESEKNTTMIPLAEICRELGFEVTWDGINKIVNVNKGSVSAGAYIGQNRYYFSKAFIPLEEEPQLIKGTTFVPISFMNRVLKGEIVIGENGILNIKY